MSLQLPQYKGDHLTYMQFCARLDDASQELREWIEDGGDKGRTVEISYETKRGKAYALLITNIVDEDEDNYVHFHINCALESHFGDEGRGEFGEATKQQVDEFFSHFAGLKLTGVSFRPQFRVPIKRIPKRGAIGLMLGAKATMADATTAVTGVKMKFLGKNPWKSMEWESRDSTSEVIIQLRSRMGSWEVADNYLEFFEKMAEEAHSRYILEEWEDTENGGT